MKRFTQSYLTSIAIIIVLINLGLVLIYTQQFVFSAQATIACVNEFCSDNIGPTELLLTNILLIGIGFVGYFIAHKIYEVHTRK